VRPLHTVAAALIGVVGCLLPVVVDAPARATTHLQVRGLITFEKNPRQPDDSRVTWRLQHWRDGRWRTVDADDWRAGSGMPGPRGRNSCAHSYGWLPDGTYHLRQYVDYPGNVIKGRAFRLDDKRCPDGTLRHDLFIHTEQGAHDTQCPNRPGDQPCRWEFPRIDDYHSLGCIKLAPADLADLVWHFHHAFRAGVRYPLARVKLIVR
jgi:hypothetical protein